MASTAFHVHPEQFSKCAPNIQTNIRQCGTVTVCNGKPVTSDELESLYLKSGDFRVMDALFKHDIEIKMCESVQNGLYDFFMANKIVTNKNLTIGSINGVKQVAPFIKARQYSPINNQYWTFYNGTSSGTAYDWKITVKSLTNIPIDENSFPAGADNGGGNKSRGLRVFLHGATGGGATIETQFEVASVTDNGNGTATLELKDRNKGSHLDPAKTAFPASGILRRGTPNVNRYERWCAEAPTYVNWKNVLFFFEETRNTLCWSERYQTWKKMVLEGNMLYSEFWNLDEAQKNKQIGKDWQDRLTYQMFFGKGEQYQNESQYDQLEDIPAYDGSAFGLGVDGGSCVGKRASVVGIYEQMAQCGRLYDAGGAKLNLPALFTEIYNMKRVREGSGRRNANQFDLFTDSVFAELINQAMIAYYNSKSQNTLRLNMDISGFSIAKKADFGFYYRSYPLFWPQGVTIHVLWHEYFDDYIAAVAGATDGSGNAIFPNDTTGRVLWVIDWAGIYPGIIYSHRKQPKVGDLAKLSQINSAFACVMDTYVQQQTLVGMIWTLIVECPKGNLIIEGLQNTVPEAVTLVGAYPGGGTSQPNRTETTTTTQTPYVG